MVSVLTDHLVLLVSCTAFCILTILLWPRCIILVYHVTHVDCVLSVLLFVYLQFGLSFWVTLPLSLTTSLFLECIAEAVLSLT